MQSISGRNEAFDLFEQMYFVGESSSKVDIADPFVGYSASGWAATCRPGGGL